MLEGDREEVIDVDKAWHGIHYLLAGDAWKGEWPANFILAGGREVEDTDTGYGAIRYLSPEEIRQVAVHLAEVNETNLAGRFNAEALNKADIYPQIWDEGEEAVEYLTTNYRNLRAFVRRGADSGKALLVFLA